jgi:malonyl-CoA/methylmalonyl-CoA synthetase
MNENLYALFAERFARNSSAVCLSSSDGRRITYRELNAQSARVANLLQSVGAKPGDRVAAQVEKSVEAVFLYLGCIRAGCVFLPLNPAYQAGELTHLIGDAQPTVLVVRPQGSEMCRKVAAEAGVAQVLELADDGTGEFLDLLVSQPEDFRTVHCHGQDLAAILYTSGTTGRAKGAMLSHRNLAIGVRVLHEYWAFRAGDVLLHILPIYHFHGIFVALNCALWNGSEILFELKFDAGKAITLLQRATVCMGVPTHYVRMLADERLDDAACHNMRLFISGSAPLLPNVFCEFQGRTGHTILERYGMTEGGMFVSNPYAGERRCGTVGKALPGIALRVVDERGNELPSGTTGGIQVKGDSVFEGYWRLPERTAQEHTVDGFFKTGDLGVLSEDGYLTIVGRDKDLIISGGLNIYPKEVEEVIDAIPGVKESAVFGLLDPDFGESVTAVVVLDPGGPVVGGETIACHVRSRLASFKVPKRVHFAAELPRNAMGKVQKVVLRQQYAGAPAPNKVPESR